MLKRYLSAFIITMIQWLILVLLSAMIINQLLSTNNELLTWHVFFETHRVLFLSLHGMIYLTAYFLWPKAIAFYVKRKKLSVKPSQLKRALFARHYVVGMLVALDLLFQMRS
ncbi:Uncharacterised protein [Legionella beliardensis]|uniref:Uncharacterized protein n=1 Tax=Legionella beliardensis TaxID=91822 RepID=A0A378JP08_9GAMM|nr:hypothetical protein [Legionella beliardensis]STX55512.1 Uncharacterised protein [Legionella beliardensis]